MIALFVSSNKNFVDNFTDMEKELPLQIQHVPSIMEAIKYIEKRHANIPIVIFDLNDKDEKLILQFLLFLKNKRYNYITVIFVYKHECRCNIQKDITKSTKKITNVYFLKGDNISKLKDELYSLIQSELIAKKKVESVTIRDILHSCHATDESCVLFVRKYRSSGEIWVENGEVIHAVVTTGEKEVFEGEKALKYLLKHSGWDVRKFPLTYPVKRTITTKFKYLLSSISRQITRQTTYDTRYVKEKFRSTTILEELTSLFSHTLINKDTLVGLWIVNDLGNVVLSKIYNRDFFIETNLRNVLFKKIEDIYSKQAELFSESSLITHALKLEPNDQDESDCTLVLNLYVKKAFKKFLIFALTYEGQKECGNRGEEDSKQKQEKNDINGEFEKQKPIKKGGSLMLSADKTKKIIEILKGVEGNEGIVIVSEEGLVIDEQLDPKYDADKVGALISVAVDAAKRVIEEIDWGKGDNMIIEAEKGKMVLYAIEHGFIVLIGNKKMNLGMARIQAEEAKKIIRD